MRKALVTGSWDAIKNIVSTALELEGESRDTYLQQTCASNPDWQAEIEELVLNHSKGREFFERLEKDICSFNFLPGCLSVEGVIADRYEVRAFLARGGWGEVYEAWDREVKERVALKILRPRWMSEAAIEQFRQEVRLARKIQSPYVCRVHDAGRFFLSGASMLFLSMELLEGETLATRLKREGKLNENRAAPILRQIAQGLNAAHAKGILHRDLKSSNVIIVREPDGSERAVLTDFGLAAPVEGPSEELMAGTPAYMAPEQVTGAALTPATDVYALGILAYEMVTGEVPFHGVTPTEQARARLTEQPRAPRTLNPALKARWERAILRCLALDPPQRFATAQALIDALERSFRKPVAATLCLLAAAGGIWGWSAHQKAVNENPLPGSVVVAVFQGVDEKSKTDAAAFREELISELSSVPGVRVIAQTTAPDVSLSPQGLANLRKQLHAGAVLSGSFRPQAEAGAADQERVTLQLTDSGSGTILWSGSYKARPSDLPQVQETVVLAGVGSLGVHLGAAQIQMAGARQSQNPAAYQSYLLGHYFASRRNTADVQQAIQYYKSAAASDSRYALPWAGMAASYNILANRGVMPAAQAYELSEQSADRALALDPNLPEALLAKGLNAHHWLWKWDDADQFFRRAISLSPGLAVAHHWRAGLLSERGRHAEALQEAEQALQLDPLSPAIHNAYAVFLYRARRYKAAIDRLESLTRQQPAFLGAKLGLAEVYCQMGRIAEAIKLGEAVAAATNRASFALADLGYFYGRGGQSQGAREILSDLEARHAKGEALAGEIAQVYLGLGDSDAAIQWLELGFSTHDEELMAVKTYPGYDSLRSDPRFLALVEKVGQ